MPDIYTFSSAIPDSQRRQLIYNGDFIIFKQVPAMIALCNFAMTLAKSFFQCEEPQKAQHHLNEADYLDVSYRLPRAFTKNQTAKQLYYRALQEVGISHEVNYCDWFPMRIQPGIKSLDALHTVGLHAHRDSWYSNILSQCNWWSPLAPMHDGHAIIFYPEYWQQKIANDSEGFNIHHFRAARAAARANNASDAKVSAAYRHIYVTEPLDDAGGIAFYLEPGDILCFSGCHLHASLPNQSNFARFSTELRTVYFDDLQKNYPMNIDSSSCGNALNDFYCMADGKSLIEQLSVSLSDAPV